MAKYPQLHSTPKVPLGIWGKAGPSHRGGLWPAHHILYLMAGKGSLNSSILLLLLLLRLLPSLFLLHCVNLLWQWVCLRIRTPRSFHVSLVSPFKTAINWPQYNLIYWIGFEKTSLLFISFMHSFFKSQLSRFWVMSNSNLGWVSPDKSPVHVSNPRFLWCVWLVHSAILWLFGECFGLLWRDFSGLPRSGLPHKPDSCGSYPLLLQYSHGKYRYSSIVWWANVFVFLYLKGNGCA